MARETQKEKIARLEAENAELRAKKDEAIAAYNTLAFQKKPEESKAITESEEYQSLKKQLAEERIKAAEAQRLYKAEAAKREQLRQDYGQLKESYDALVTAHNALTSDLDTVKEDLQAQLKEALQSHAEPHNARGAGRKAILTEDQEIKARTMHQSGVSMRQIAKHFDCSAATIHKAVHKLKNK